MVTHLLVRGHRLDVFPLAPITRSLNAAMYAVTKRPPWPKGLALLAPHADFDLRTPIYECHILHFTVARLDLALLENVISITRAEAATLRPTALEHTLVHIACLSLDETWINVHAATVYASIHEVPTLSECWKRQSLWPPGLSKLPGPEAEVDTWPRSNFDAHQLAQTNVVIFLFKASIDMITELNKQELYGNRALHYLAGNRCVDEELLTELRQLSPWCGKRFEMLLDTAPKTCMKMVIVLETIGISATCPSGRIHIACGMGL